MCARDTVDQKNIDKVREICNGYPDLVLSYIIGLRKKTTYTQKAYAYYVCRFLDYVAKELKLNIMDVDSYKGIKPMNIDFYLNSIRVKQDGSENSATYITANFASIHGFFKFLKRNGYIDSDPCSDTETPKDNKVHQITVIDNDDLDTMMKNIGNGVGSAKARHTQEKWMSRDKAFISLGVTTGLRLSAIVGLDMNDIDFDEQSILVTEKGNIQRKVYFGDTTKETLKAWIGDRANMKICDINALFIAQGGRRMATRTAQDLMARITNGTKKHITPHKMRATCATRLYEATGDIYRVQTQLGHKNIENTKRYASVSEEKKRESANILDSIF